MELQRLSCSELRESLIGFMSEQTEVYDGKDSCVITLPFKTMDDRLVDVYVERRATDFFLVHDGGRTVSELVSHGVKLTEGKINLLNRTAKTFGAGLQERRFLIGCKLTALQESIIGIAQCATVGTIEILKHAPSFTEEPVVDRLSEVLRSWGKRNKATIGMRVKVAGQTAQHEFHFVAYPQNSTNLNTIAIEILNPSYTPMVTAQRYGFLRFDLQQTSYGKWKRLAVLGRGDEWTADAISLIDKHAQGSVRIESAEMGEIENDIPPVMDRLLAAA